MQDLVRGVLHVLTMLTSAHISQAGDVLQRVPCFIGLSPVRVCGGGKGSPPWFESQFPWYGTSLSATSLSSAAAATV